MSDRHITIVGAGLAGALLATLLARRGWSVDMYEKRGDPRLKGYEGGRSINLALAERGRHALALAGADDAVMTHAVMMRGRLHIWPRGRYMCIALPHDERTFTVTLVLPNESDRPGDPSFENVRDGDEARALFERDFADALPLIPQLEQDFERNPAGLLATLYLDRWHLDDRAVLVGDAAHAMVPFHGQGMNCAFEDCVALADHLERAGGCADAFAAFQAERLPNARAIQAMALENYLEMRDRVDDEDYLLQRALERTLAERHPDRFVPRYSMVTFSRLPYAIAFERGQVQRELLVELTRGHSSLDTLHWDGVDATVRERLSPLPVDETPVGAT